MNTFKPLRALISCRQVLRAGLAVLALSGMLRAVAKEKPSKTSNGYNESEAKKSSGKRAVVLDPGHGGIDTGAAGRNGSKGKHVVLATAKNARPILRNHGTDVHLMRSSDTFIPLYDCVEIAYKHGADLFMPIYADGFTNPKVAGASILTLPDCGASSATAEHLSEHENRTDEVAGKKATDKNHLLWQVLFDLMQTDTIKDSLALGSYILRKIEPVHKLHSRNTEQAAFVVLKSPSVLSALVEISFIANPEEERLLGATVFRQKIIIAITEGVISYFHWLDNQKVHLRKRQVMKPDAHQVKRSLLGFQDMICQQLSIVDGAEFVGDSWQREAGGSERSRVLRNGGVFEQAGVSFSHVHGEAMPAPTTTHRPELVGRSSKAMDVSLVVHLHNPYISTSHTNVRLFIAEKPGVEPIWWLGDGFDLTPFYGFEEDAIHWHRTTRDLCLPFSRDAYPRYKKQCDECFHLKHCNKQRSIGELFFGGLNTPDFDHCFALMQTVGKGYTNAYLPIVERQKAMAYGKRERSFQLYYHGRYAKFNLVWDRGTLFGLQAGGRTESILMSIPPLVRQGYDYQPKDGNLETALGEFIKVGDWM